MIKKLTLIAFAMTTGVLLIQMSANTANSSSSGAPAGYCGGPGSLGTCATCHAGTATPSPTPIISSNVPQTGYVPGSTYTITMTMSQSGISEFGFQVSPLSPTGALVGGLLLTNPTQTQIVNLKYV
ncbi:MAG: choice-of-anchor V domain-containing protein, partial [Bacteroidota bacterium]